MDYPMGEDAFQHEISECVSQFDDANPNDSVVLNRDDVEPERVILKKPKDMINDDIINDTIFDDVEDRREEASSENKVEFRMGKQLHNKRASIRVNNKISSNNIGQVVSFTTSLFQHQQPRTEESHVQIVTQNDSSNMQEVQSEPSSTYSINTKKRTRGKYKFIRVDMKTKNGKTTTSLRAKKWTEIAASSSRQMWLQVKEKFFTEEDGQEFRLKAFVVTTCQRLYRGWKHRLHKIYLKFDTLEEKFHAKLEDVTPED
ncbi:hypothetical protein ACFE04_002727 [Oxalis oulophora]